MAFRLSQGASGSVGYLQSSITWSYEALPVHHQADTEISCSVFLYADARSGDSFHFIYISFLMIFFEEILNFSLMGRQQLAPKLLYLPAFIPWPQRLSHTSNTRHQHRLRSPSFLVFFIFSFHLSSTSPSHCKGFIHMPAIPDCKYQSAGHQWVPTPLPAAFLSSLLLSPSTAHSAQQRMRNADLFFPHEQCILSGKQ